MLKGAPFEAYQALKSKRAINFASTMASYKINSGLIMIDVQPRTALFILTHFGIAKESDQRDA